MINYIGSKPGCAKMLKMNASKTEFILFGSPKQMKMCSSTSIPVVTDTVERSLQIRLLGAWFDENVTMKVHVTKVFNSNVESVKA